MDSTGPTYYNPVATCTRQHSAVFFFPLSIRFATGSQKRKAVLHSCVALTLHSDGSCSPSHLGSACSWSPVRSRTEEDLRDGVYSWELRLHQSGCGSFWATQRGSGQLGRAVLCCMLVSLYFQVMLHRLPSWFKRAIRQQFLFLLSSRSLPAKWNPFYCSFHVHFHLFSLLPFDVFISEAAF